MPDTEGSTQVRNVSVVKRGWMSEGNTQVRIVSDVRKGWMLSEQYSSQKCKWCKEVLGAEGNTLNRNESSVNRGWM